MKYILLAIISGLLLSVSWPTYGVPFFIFFALVPLLIMEHEILKFSNIKQKSAMVFLGAYLAFLLWNIVTTGWLYGSKNPDGSHSLMAVLFPVLVNALLYTLVFLGYHHYKKKKGTYWGLAFFVVFWMVFEKFHLSWELSWPWLNLGNVFSGYPQLIQWYDTFGATGGSLWILLINVFLFYTIRIWEAGRNSKLLIKNLSIVILAILSPMLVSIFKYHSFRPLSIGEVAVLMLQPDLDPYDEKYSKDSVQILSELLTLAQEHTTGKVDYYIAPETALPGNGSISETELESNLLLNNIKEFLNGKAKASFVGGISSHRFFDPNAPAPANAYRLPSGYKVESYNSAIQIIPKQSVEVYHKGKLVPGVEIFPYMNVLKPILGDVMIDLGGTVASLGADQERSVFQNPFNTGNLAPIICYESIYGEFTTEYVRKGANFLAIMTNDSWWGVSEGHKQLLSYARLRAIETRREIARAANSGISAHINALGEIEASTFYGDKTALYAKIKLYEDETFYVRTGDLLSRICVFIFGFLVFYPLFQKLIKRVKIQK